MPPPAVARIASRGRGLFRPASTRSECAVSARRMGISIHSTPTCAELHSGRQTRRHSRAPVGRTCTATPGLARRPTHQFCLGSRLPPQLQIAHPKCDTPPPMPRRGGGQIIRGWKSIQFTR